MLSLLQCFFRLRLKVESRMVFKLSLVLVLIALWHLPEAQSVCTFELVGTSYVCRLAFQTIDSENDMQVSGVHLEGFNDSNVTWLAQRWSTVQVFPSAIIDEFVNLRTVFLGSTQMRLFNSPITNCANLETISLFSNLITSIPEGIFRNCANLVTLELSFNNISRIHVNAFVGLTSLSILSLGGNRIADVNFQWFLPLPSLAALRLFENQITSWNSTLLANNPKMEALHLDSNQIRTLDADVFSNLPNLNFLTVGSLMEEFPTLQNVPRLEFLFLHNNRLRTVSVNQFINMESLKHLYLTNNRIESINFTIGENEVLNKLETLLLNRNNITNIPDNVFSALESLERLDLSDNQIQRLSANSIRPIHQMRDLIVSRNQIWQIERELFDNVTRLEFQATRNICINSFISIFDGWLSSANNRTLEQCFTSAASKNVINLTALISVLILLCMKI